MLIIATWKCIALMFGALSCGVGLGWALRGYRFAVRIDRVFGLQHRGAWYRYRMRVDRHSRIIADDEVRP